ncbi:MAG: NAD(P)-dependent oxidoreductase [Bacteroidota bacterium]
MKILISGATGFIGRHLVSTLLERNHEIVIIKHPQDASELDPRVLAYTFNPKNVEKDIEFLIDQKIDGVAHLASLFLASHKSDDIKALIDTNLFFSTYLLECSSKANIRWFINTGTFWQNYKNSEYSPVNIYAATKQAFQSIAQFYIDTNRINFATLKLCDTYGRGDTRPKILNLFDRISKSGESVNMSEGEQVLDISHVDDVVDAFYKLMLLMSENKIKNGSIFAVKANKRTTLKELADIFQSVTGKKLNIIWGGRPYREREVMHPWECGVVVPGWSPKVTIQDGIKSIFKD